MVKVFEANLSHVYRLFMNAILRLAVKFTCNKVFLRPHAVLERGKANATSMFHDCNRS